MRVSAGLPTGMEGLTYPIPFSDPENIIRIAQAAETFGYRNRIQLRREIVQTTFAAAEQAVKANSTDTVQHQLIGDFVARAASDGRPATTATSAPAA